MSFILSHVRPANLQAWIKTNAVGSLKTTPSASWSAYLAANSGTGNTIHDQEMAFLKAAGATGGTNYDLWNSYLNAQTGKTGPEKARNKYK